MLCISKWLAFSYFAHAFIFPSFPLKDEKANKGNTVGRSPLSPVQCKFCVQKLELWSYSQASLVPYEYKLLSGGNSIWYLIKSSLDSHY